jgi:toxin ParE1/3/4
MKGPWTFNARSDLNEIWEHIAADNIDAADGLIEKLRRASMILGRSPRAGRRGRELGTRELVVAGTKYILIYEIVGNSVHVLRALHGARQWPPS